MYAPYSTAQARSCPPLSIVGYTERIIREWQVQGLNFWPDQPSGDIRDLPALREFLTSTEKSFHPNVRTPYEGLIRAVQHELLGGRKSDNRPEGNESKTA